MAEEEPTFEDIQETLKRSSAALKSAGIEFVLAGGVACWARGGPSTTHDIDYMVRPDDAEAALDALAEAGMRVEHPPEEWLEKAWDGNVLIDLIHAPIGLAVDDDLFERSGVLDVLGVSVHVMRIEDVLTAKLLALHEHYLDLEPLIDIARSVREQIDWDELRARTDASPYARAFFTIADGLGLTGATPESERHPGGLAPDGRRAVDSTGAASAAERAS
jgi:predicted nucleotidyltransferase